MNIRAKSLNINENQRKIIGNHRKIHEHLRKSTKRYENHGKIDAIKENLRTSIQNL